MSTYIYINYLKRYSKAYVTTWAYRRCYVAKTGSSDHLRNDVLRPSMNRKCNTSIK